MTMMISSTVASSSLHILSFNPFYDWDIRGGGCDIRNAFHCRSSFLSFWIFKQTQFFSAGQEKWLGRILSIICIVVRRNSWLSTDWTLRLEKTRLMSRDWSGGLKRFDRNTFSTARSHHVDMLVWSLLSFSYKIPLLQCFIGLNLNRASKGAFWNWNQLGTQVGW